MHGVWNAGNTYCMCRMNDDRVTEKHYGRVKTARYGRCVAWTVAYFATRRADVF